MTDIRDSKKGGDMPATALASQVRQPAPKIRRGRPQPPSLRIAPAIREAKVQAATDDLARRFAECRALGHTWQHVGFADANTRAPLGQYNAFGYVSTCAHCGTQRTKWMSRYGNRGSITYRHPDGYLRQGEAKLTLQEWRRTWIVTVLGDDA